MPPTAGEITPVVVWKLDRLARSLEEGVNVLADWCQRDVRVIAVTLQIDLSGPVGHLMASLLFGIAEIELQHAKERQAAGIALAKQGGVYTGRRQGTTKAAPARAQALKQQELTICEIAQALGVKERTVYYYLVTLDTLYGPAHGDYLVAAALADLVQESGEAA